MILFLAVASNIYGAVFARLGTATLITNTMLGLQVSPLLMMVILMAVIFILGWPLEWPAIVLIFVPIFYPVVQELGFNLVWFATLVAVNLQTAFLSPPVAMAAYYLKGVAPAWELTDIYRRRPQDPPDLQYDPVSGGSLQHLWVGICQAGDRHPDHQYHAWAASLTVDDDGDFDGRDLHSGLAAGMAGHRPDLRSHILPRGPGTGIQSGVVCHTGGGEFTDGLSLSAGGNGGLLP
jgi:hypothetical protein